MSMWMPSRVTLVGLIDAALFPPPTLAQHPRLLHAHRGCRTCVVHASDNEVLMKVSTVSRIRWDGSGEVMFVVYGNVIKASMRTRFKLKAPTLRVRALEFALRMSRYR